MKFLLYALILIVAMCCASATHTDYFVYRAAGKVPFDKDGIPQMVLTVTKSRAKHPNLVFMARVSYNQSAAEIGWDQITVAPHKKLFTKNVEDALTAWYAAGYAEGYATMESIGQVLIAQAYNYSAAGQTWVDKHLEYVQSNAATKQDAFWVQVRKQLLQMHGMAAGYNARAKEAGSTATISFDDVYQVNLYNEYSDIGPAAQDLYGGGRKKIGGGAALRVGSRVGPKTVPEGEEHCSGFVKLTDDDLFLSHVTWCGYYLFVGRQYKTYEMETTVSMSANAALINSGDDWYQTSNKLSVIETTNEFTNNALFAKIVPTCVAEFMRVMIANYLATTAQDWTKIFSQEPSGTYCNQWMIIDYKLYKKGMKASELPDNLFWILEPIPGLIESADMTWFVRQNTYWGSYNIPYFPKIFAASGFQQQVDAYGPAFSWDDCPRAQIFRRDHGKVTDLHSVQRMMRYNDWQHDPLSAIQNCTGCNPANSPMIGISSRGDLVPANATFGNLNPNYSQMFSFAFFGATDAKISSSDMINDGFKMSFINGPTHDTQSVFSWNIDPSNALAQLPGMPQTFNFEWQTVQPIAEPKL